MRQKLILWMKRKRCALDCLRSYWYTNLSPLWLIQAHAYTHLALVRRWIAIVSLQVLYDARDAERPSEAQQVSQVAEGAAEQDGTTERSIHGAPDRWGTIRILSCLCGETVDRRQKKKKITEVCLLILITPRLIVKTNSWNIALMLNQVKASICSPSDPHRRLWAVGSWWGLSWRWAACRSSSALWASYGLQWWEDSSTNMLPKNEPRIWTIFCALLPRSAPVTFDIVYET